MENNTNVMNNNKNTNNNVKEYTKDEVLGILDQTRNLVTTAYESVFDALLDSTIAHAYKRCGNHASPERIYEELFKFPLLAENAKGIMADYPLETMIPIIKNFKSDPKNRIFFSVYGGGFIDPISDRCNE